MSFWALHYLPAGETRWRRGLVFNSKKSALIYKARANAQAKRAGASPWNYRIIEIKDSAKVEVKCGECDGRGDVMVKGLPGDSWPETCRHCNGTGKRAPHASP